MFNFFRDFIREVFYNFRRRGIVRIILFDGGAVSIGVAIFALANMGGSSSAFGSGFGIGVVSIGILGLMSSLYESNFSLSRIVGYFFLEGGALQAGTLLYSLSNYGPPESRTPSLAHIGIGVGCVGVCCVLYVFRQMAVLYTDETIQIVRDLREFYRSESSAGNRMTRRRRSVLRSIGLQLRVLSWSLRRRHLKESPTTAEGESSEMPQESDSESEDKAEIPGAVGKSKEIGTPSSSEEPQARGEVNAAKSACYPLYEESPEIRTGTEKVASSSESQKIHGSSEKIFASKKEIKDIYAEDIKSQTAHGATKSIDPSEGTSEYESKDEHGARKKVHLFTEATTKTQVERQPNRDLLSAVDRSSSTATSEADDLKYLEQVFGVLPPRKVSPEPLRKRKVGLVEMKLQEAKDESPSKENSGERSELKKQPEQTRSYKSREHTDCVAGGKRNEKEFELNKRRASDAREKQSVDHLEMKQEINSAVEELVAILNAIIKTSPESNIDVTPDDQEIGRNAEVSENNLDDNSTVSRCPEFDEICQKSAERAFEVLSANESSESRKYFPKHSDEHQLEPSTEVINYILGGCSGESPNLSIPESSSTTETLEAIKEIIVGCLSVPPLESIDECEENRTLEEVEITAHGVSIRNSMPNSDVSETDQAQDPQNVKEEIQIKSQYSAENSDPTHCAEQNVYKTRGSILEDPRRNEAWLKNSDDYKLLKVKALNFDESRTVMESVIPRAELDMEEPSSSRQEESQIAKRSILHQSEPQFMKKGILHYKELQAVVENIMQGGEPQSVTENVLRIKELHAMEESDWHSVEYQPFEEGVLYSGVPQPVTEYVLQSDELQPVEEIISHSSKPQPVEEIISHSSKPQPVEEIVSQYVEPHPVGESESHSDDSKPMEENVSHRGESQPVKKIVSHSGEPQHVEENVKHKDKSQPVIESASHERQQVEESASYSGDSQPTEESTSHSDEPPPVEEIVSHRGEPQTVKESGSHSCDSQPVEQGVSQSGEPQPVEGSVSNTDELQPVEESVLHSGEPQPVEESISHSDKIQPAEESVIHNDEFQPMEESVSHISEPQPVEESISHSGKIQPVEESFSHSGEPQPVKEIVSHSGDSQPMEGNALHSDKSQPAEESVSQSCECQQVEESLYPSGELQIVEEIASHRGEPQSVKEIVSYSDEPRPMEESVPHCGEPQPVEESVLHRGDSRPMQESALQIDKSQSVEESVSHSCERQKVEESTSYSYYY